MSGLVEFPGKIITPPALTFLLLRRQIAGAQDVLICDDPVGGVARPGRGHHVVEGALERLREGDLWLRREESFRLAHQDSIPRFRRTLIIEAASSAHKVEKSFSHRPPRSIREGLRLDGSAPRSIRTTMSATPSGVGLSVTI